eukprot:3679109-Amphidinium_carterae.5
MSIHIASPKKKRRHRTPSSRSSLERLLKNAESSSDDDLGHQLREVKKTAHKQAEVQDRSQIEGCRRAASGSSTVAPAIYTSLRKAGMTPLQVGQVAAEMQVTAASACACIGVQK